jgi:hypothetical protein
MQNTKQKIINFEQNFMTDKLKQKVSDLKNNSASSDFETLALEVFEYQSRHCDVYKQYLSYIGTTVSKVNNCADIPFLPIDFFKKFYVSSKGNKHQTFFQSSSTSGKGVSKHYVFDLNYYLTNSINCFESNFNPVDSYCHLALMPSYLENRNSSIINMLDNFIKRSKYQQSGFFLYNHQELQDIVLKNEAMEIPTILWGVTFALLDFGKDFPLPLNNTSIIETGGMKGRKKELTRKELYQLFKQYFGNQCSIYSEYGMTELFSQSYSLKDGLFKCPPQMRVTGRDLSDPLSNKIEGRGLGLNVIDLANIDTCSFLALQDLGNIYPDGTFEVLGRIDFSDERGCSLMVSK